MNDVRSLLDALVERHSLTLEEYKFLIENRDEQSAEYAANKAVKIRKAVFGNSVYIRGLIEIGNICKNDCYYCGIRRSNTACDRYRLSDDDILKCCDEGYAIGFRTFVMQGGEDAYFSADKICDIVSRIKSKYPDCAVTLSLGEYLREDYVSMFNAGADRYLLRHETANNDHYGKLHPEKMLFDNRIRCLYDLKDIGFQTGCGFMVGSPYQTTDTLSEDLKFIEEFKPAMCGIGPFIPHKDTPFRDYPAGSAELTCFLLSIIRIMHPRILLPATTALGTIDPVGREKGIKSGANVVMPNLSPISARNKYQLYDNKLSTGAESAQNLMDLKERLKNIGYEIVVSRGDALK
jgi:biotin synthase